MESGLVVICITFHIWNRIKIVLKFNDYY